MNLTDNSVKYRVGIFFYTLKGNETEKIKQITGHDFVIGQESAYNTPPNESHVFLVSRPFITDNIGELIDKQAHKKDLSILSFLPKCDLNDLDEVVISESYGSSQDNLLLMIYKTEKLIPHNREWFLGYLSQGDCDPFVSEFMNQYDLVEYETSCFHQDACNRKNILHLLDEREAEISHLRDMINRR